MSAPKVPSSPKQSMPKNQQVQSRLLGSLGSYGVGSRESTVALGAYKKTELGPQAITYGNRYSEIYNTFKEAGKLNLLDQNFVKTGEAITKAGEQTGRTGDSLNQFYTINQNQDVFSKVVSDVRLTPRTRGLVSNTFQNVFANGVDQAEVNKVLTGYDTGEFKFELGIAGSRAYNKSLRPDLTSPIYNPLMSDVQSANLGALKQSRSLLTSNQIGKP